MNPDPRNVPSPDPYGSQPSWREQPPQRPGGQPPYPGAPQSQPPHGYRGGKGKWILVGLAMVTVIAVSAVTIVLVLRPDSSSGTDNGTPTATSDSEFASANDTGPANIITEEPTCEGWTRTATEYADTVKTVGWANRDKSVPASSWTPQLRAMYETVGEAMRRAADQTATLAQRTPHRVMRELYQQFTAYARDFIDRIPSYVADNDDLAVVTDTVGNSASNICSAIEYGSAQALSTLIDAPKGPSQQMSAGDPAIASVFLADGNAVCSEWAEMVSAYDDATAPWLSIDPNIAASAWNPEQKAVIGAVAPIMNKNADELEDMGRRSGNTTVEDFAVLGAQYRRAYAAALPTYTPRDSFLAESATYLVKVVDWACKATD